MKTDDRTLHAPTVHARTRGGRRVGAVAVAALFALGACTSDPGARRVAQDIINAETEDDSSSDRRDCMLQVLKDDFTDAELETITDQINSSNEGSQAEGQDALDAFGAALASCN